MQVADKPRLSVIGLGKLGSPMAAVFGAKGFNVIGVDVNERLVQALNKGRAPVPEPQLQDYLERAGRRVRATLDFDEAIAQSDVSFIIVPTPSGADRLFSNRYVVEAIEKLGRALSRKQTYHLVVLTSTVIPGATGGPVRAALERASGRNIGQSLGLCYSPEFIALGSVIHDMLNPDFLLIGESDTQAGDLLEAIYAQTVESKPSVHRMNFVSAELCKLSVNTFVTTKISYANMIADMCDHLPGADADVVTRAIGADSRIGFKYLKPAVGYGGPCFPRDNKAFAALGRSLGVDCCLAEATDQINDHQIQRLAEAVAASTSPGERVSILGLSYKAQTSIIEESQAITLALLLSKSGYPVTVYDPCANAASGAVLGNTVTVAVTAAEAVGEASTVVIMTPWPEFAEVSWNCGITDPEQRTVIDPWGIVRPAPGIRLVRLGAGDWRRSVASAAPSAPLRVESR